MSKTNRNTSQRRNRVEAVRKEQARSQRKNRVVFITLTLVGVLVIGGLTAWGLVSNKSAAQIVGLSSYDNLSQNHVTSPVTYPQTPPVGGDHDATPQNCGVYSSPIVDGNGVHSLEHGAVWITYQPDLSADQIATLTGLADGHDYLLISPFPKLPAPVVASAWGKQLSLDSADDPRLAQFIGTYENGPQNPEPGAPCSGGIGDPQ